MTDTMTDTMTFTLLFVVAGLILVTMALGGSVLRRLPLTTAILYLAAGVALGPQGLGLFALDPIEHAGFLERVTEVAIVISLFTAGLKLRAGWDDRRWLLPLRLAFGAMALTVALIAVIGVVGLGLSLGAAVLLGAILAPTDPVLASDVQVDDPGDRDRLRFALTGEAGFNDGSAFPFVMLGLGLLGLHELGPFGLRWLGVDVAWSVLAGLTTGWLLGTAVGHLVLYLRRTHREAVGSDEFLTLGLIALAYGAALLLHAYGFLAVFAAGWAVRRIEQRTTGTGEPPDAGVIAAGRQGAAAEIATRPETAPAFMAQAVLGFNEQLERIGEVAVVVLLGAMLSARYLPGEAFWFVPLLFFVVRPLSVWLTLRGCGVSPRQRAMTAWFGIRGLGSVYYLTFALVHGYGSNGADAQLLAGLTLTTVAASIVAHGVSVTPLMDRYRRADGPPSDRPGNERPTPAGEPSQPRRPAA